MKMRSAFIHDYASPQSRGAGRVTDDFSDRDEKEFLLAHLQLLRPLHSVKSVITILLGPLLLIGSATPEKLATVFLTLVAFILASSAVYIFNDLMDVERDRHHPQKCKRPLASGLIRIITAQAMAAALTIATLITLLFLPLTVVATILSYIIVNLFYSLWLKHTPIIEMMLVSCGFVFRTLAGFLAFDAVPNNWVLAAVAAGSLMLTIGKRREELRQAGGTFPHRPVLQTYSEQLLDIYMFIAAVMLLGTASGALYTQFSAFGMHILFWISMPFVVFLMMNYLLLVYSGTSAGNPTKLIATNPKIRIAICAWTVMVVSVYVVIERGHLDVLAAQIGGAAK